MARPRFYEIWIEGEVTDRWTDWFEGLAIEAGPNGETRLSGMLADQAALLGVLNTLHGLNLMLISVNCRGSEVRAGRQKRHG